MLDRILDRMGEIVHRIDAPLIACVVVRHVGDAVNDRVAHIDVRGGHIDLCAQHLLAVRILSFLHLFKELQVLLHGTVPVGAFLSGLGQGAAVLLDLLRRKITDIRLAFFNQENGALIHFLEVIGSEIQPVLPVRAEPGNIFLDRFHELDLFLGRIGIVKTQVELAAVLLCQAVVQKDGLGVADVQIAVRLRRESGHDVGVDALGQILVDGLLNKIAGYRCGLFCCFHIFLHNCQLY